MSMWWPHTSFFLRYAVILNVMLLFATTSSYAQQQPEDSEHASHHPEATNDLVSSIQKIKSSKDLMFSLIAPFGVKDVNSGFACVVFLI